MALIHLESPQMDDHSALLVGREMIDAGVERINREVGCTGLDELARELGIAAKEEHDYGPGVFIEGESGNHYPIFLLSVKFLKRIERATRVFLPRISEIPDGD